MSTEAADVSLPVQRQLEAYNRRDIEAFMPWWAQDCRYYAFPDQLVAEGADAIRARHIERFREPNLHGRLVGRFVVGNLVVDQEVVTRTFPEGPGEVDVLAIYEIEDGRITRAWFKMGTPRLLAIPSERLVVTVAVEHPVQEEVASLLRRSDAVAAQLYPGEYRRPISPDTLAVPGTHVLLARREGLAIGLCVLFERGDSTVELKRMIVNEQARGQGVGAALVHGAEAAASRLGAGTVLLEVGVRNTEAQALYRRAGYVVRDVFSPYRPSPISLFMEKRL